MSHLSAVNLALLLLTSTHIYAAAASPSVQLERGMAVVDVSAGNSLSTPQY